MDPLLRGALSFLPDPPISCADCIAFKQFQAFDITALVESVSAPRPVASRYVREIFLIDGTKTSGVASPAAAKPDESRPEQCVIPKVVMFYDRVASGTEDPPIVKDMVENAGKDAPYHFFGLQARTAQKGGHVISTSRTWYKIEKAQIGRAHV